jgi:hypothetical protein
MKEGIGINKSLTALGNCIEKLALRAKKGTGKEVHVPYRSATQQAIAAQHTAANTAQTDGCTDSLSVRRTNGQNKRTEKRWTRRESIGRREENNGERGDCSVD